jgi:hypothetical protein
LTEDLTIDLLEPFPVEEELAKAVRNKTTRRVQDPTFTITENGEERSLRGWHELEQATGAPKASLRIKLAYGGGQCQLPGNVVIKRTSFYARKQKRHDGVLKTPHTISFTLTCREWERPVHIEGWPALAAWTEKHTEDPKTIRQLQSLFFQRNNNVTLERGAEKEAVRASRNEEIGARVKAPTSAVPKVPTSFPKLVRVPVRKD